MTYTVVNNATYKIDKCLAFCDGIPEWGVFAHSFVLENALRVISFQCSSISSTCTSSAFISHLTLTRRFFCSYEFNNKLLDHEFPEQSNLKCAAFGDVHSADEKLNFGGQFLSGEQCSSALTYIQQSSGWASKTLSDPLTPDGYVAVANLDGANEAPGVRIRSSSKLSLHC